MAIRRLYSVPGERTHRRKVGCVRLAAEETREEFGDSSQVLFLFSCVHEQSADCV